MKRDLSTKVAAGADAAGMAGVEVADVGATAVVVEAEDVGGMAVAEVVDAEGMVAEDATGKLSPFNLKIFL
jgi:hypothetical protein